MITVEPIADNVLSIDVTGKITDDDIAKVRKPILAALRDNAAVSFLIDLTGYAGITPAGLVADMRFGLDIWPDIGRIERVAVMAGHDWVRHLVAIEAWMFRSMDIRAFDIDQRPLARRFALGQVFDVETRQPSIMRLLTSRPDCLAFRLTGPISRADSKAISGLMAEAMETHGTIDLLVSLEAPIRFDPGLLFSSDMWAMKTAAISHVRRYAIVGAPAVLSSVSVALGSLMPVEIKSFEQSEVDEAWHWLDAKPTAEAA